MRKYAIGLVGLALLAVFTSVALLGCGGSHATSTQPTTPTTPPPPAAGASPWLTPAGYAALRGDLVAEQSLIRSRSLSATSRLAKLGALCDRLGNDPNNRQVRALRAECTAAVEEANTYLALDKCPKAADVPARRACVVHELQLLAAVLHRENSLDNDLTAAISAGPCRNLLLAGYREHAQLADATERAARALQTAKTANDARGPLQAWARAVAAVGTVSRRVASTLKRQLPVCRPR